MEFLIIYFIFATTTSIAGFINLVKPVLNRIQKDNPLCDISRSPKISYFIFIVIGILIAPVYFLPSILPSFARSFKDSLYNSLMDNNDYS